MHPGIREHMEVVGSDGGHVGRVDHVIGQDIELAKLDHAECRQKAVSAKTKKKIAKAKRALAVAKKQPPKKVTVARQ